MRSCVGRGQDLQPTVSATPTLVTPALSTALYRESRSARSDRKESSLETVMDASVRYTFIRGFDRQGGKVDAKAEAKVSRGPGGEARKSPVRGQGSGAEGQFNSHRTSSPWDLIYSTTSKAVLVM